MTYDPNDHKAPLPYDEGNNPDPESDDDVFESLTPWGVNDEDAELNLAAKLQQQSTISNSPPPEEADVADELEDDNDLDDEEEEMLPWASLEEAEMEEIGDEME